MHNLSSDTSLSAQELQTLLVEHDELARMIDRRQLVTYRPYTKQKQFHDLGAEAFPERLLMAGNQLGKTLSAGAEWAMHLTGRYPDWWQGAVFEKPTKLWAAGVSVESTRDNPQRILVGPPALQESWGTGMIPGDAIVDTNRKSGGVPDALDTVVVRWGGGGDVQAGESVLSFKAYEQGRTKWQGPTIDGVWFDEEPPADVYSEGKTRTQHGQRGIFTAITFTPMEGMTEVVRDFLTERELQAMIDG